MTRDDATSMTTVRPEAASVDVPRSESIEELFAALESPLLSYAQRLLGERTPAEDMVQDAFMKLHSQFAEVREPRRWLYRTVHNLALNHRRKTGKIVPLEQPSGASPAGPPETADPEPL
ncbi:MAG TPA: RNA polymerase sigma factor, partial [Verrucomicrobiae bacterium]